MTRFFAAVLLTSCGADVSVRWPDGFGPGGSFVLLAKRTGQVVAEDYDPAGLLLPIEFQERPPDLEVMLYDVPVAALMLASTEPDMTGDPLPAPMSVWAPAEGWPDLGWRSLTDGALQDLRFSRDREACLQRGGCLDEAGHFCQAECGFQPAVVEPLVLAEPSCPEWPSCDRRREGGLPACGLGQAILPGGEVCERLVSSCPSGEFRDVAPGDTFVLQDAQAGDGSDVRPFGTIGEAVSAGATRIQLGSGTYVAGRIDAPLLEIVGSCPERTTVTDLRVGAPLDVSGVVVSAPVVELMGVLTLRQSVSRGTMTVLGGVILRNVIAEGTIGPSIEIVAGASADVERAEIGGRTGVYLFEDASINLKDVTFRGGLFGLDTRGTAHLENVAIHGTTDAAIRVLSSSVSASRLFVDAEGDSHVISATESDVVISDGILLGRIGMSDGSLQLTRTQINVESQERFALIEAMNPNVVVEDTSLLGGWPVMRAVGGWISAHGLELSGPQDGLDLNETGGQLFRVKTNVGGCGLDVEAGAVFLSHSQIVGTGPEPRGVCVSEAASVTLTNVEIMSTAVGVDAFEESQVIGSFVSIFGSQTGFNVTGAQIDLADVEISNTRGAAIQLGLGDFTLTRGRVVDTAIGIRGLGRELPPLHRLVPLVVFQDVEDVVVQ